MEKTCLNDKDEYPNDDVIYMKILFIKKENKVIQHRLINSKINAVGINKLKDYISETSFRIIGIYGDYNFTNYVKFESERIVALLQK